jgi:malate synthase
VSSTETGRSLHWACPTGLTDNANAICERKALSKLCSVQAVRDALMRNLTMSKIPRATLCVLRRLKPEGQVATLLVRPRGWHMEEKHMLVDGEPVR